MSAGRVVARPRARADVEGAIDYYRREAGARVALGFVRALERALESIGRQPGAGSPRFGHELGLAGLRTRRLGRYPYLIFYVEREGAIDVWRVLHARRDIPAALGDGG